MSSYPPEDVHRAFRNLVAALLTYTANSARHLGLSLVESAALEHLYNAGELTPGQLGARLAMGSGTVTAIIDRLEQAGYIERARHPHDRRSWLLRPRGSAFDQLRGARAELSGELLALAAGLSESERVAVAGYLAAVTEAMTKHSE